MGRTIEPTPAQAATLFGYPIVESEAMTRLSEKIGEIKLGPPICTVCGEPAVYDAEAGHWYCPANRIVIPT